MPIEDISENLPMQGSNIMDLHNIAKNEDLDLLNPRYLRLLLLKSKNTSVSLSI